MTFYFVLLLIGCFSAYLANPIQINAQDKSIFSDNPKSDRNDDTRLCEGEKAPLRNDKYCMYYRGYRTNEEANPNLARIYRNKMLYVILPPDAPVIDPATLPVEATGDPPANPHRNKNYQRFDFLNPFVIKKRNCFDI
jgi:hypothetical protein